MPYQLLVPRQTVNFVVRGLIFFLFGGGWGEDKVEWGERGDSMPDAVGDTTLHLRLHSTENVEEPRFLVPT